MVGEVSRDFGSDACTSGGVHTDVFFAYRISGQSLFHCPFHAGIPTFGSGGLFDVVYQNGAWHANWNGNEVQGSPLTGLGFSSGWSVASDVAFVDKGALAPAEAITFGPQGHNPWQFTTNNGSTYSTIQTSQLDQNTDTDDDSDGDWNLQGTPSPFNINWTGY